MGRRSNGPITKEIRSKICAAANTGKSPTEIVKDMGLGYGTVYNTLYAAGLRDKTKKRKYVRRAVVPVTLAKRSTLEDILARYKEGKNNLKIELLKAIENL